MLQTIRHLLSENQPRSTSLSVKMLVGGLGRGTIGLNIKTTMRRHERLKDLPCLIEGFNVRHSCLLRLSMVVIMPFERFTNYLLVLDAVLNRCTLALERIPTHS